MKKLEPSDGYPTVTFHCNGRSKRLILIPPIKVLGDGDTRLCVIRFISDDNFFMTVAAAGEIEFLGLKLQPEHTHRIDGELFETYAKASAIDLEKASSSFLRITFMN